ncbi:dTDP-4-dehydrorhamnose 3,5-epimerase [Fusobacterium necrophorum subsp. necrophorum]|nr:dTDP-4-dehydrorhamnose 3,5-epimerase family protein [Fusobacterium necrophorum]SQC98644.1 dTDP-4-dehydrorhamnose 3,5-epimerase [Fusobacterium necrophorum subsp. necrophorum]SQC98881.1 dTDP-4-dehydrorhamnose 3,5-epimerase [Fusobacterium necrophorum subsp. necrophorum]SQD09917.1 dTDP-4-dehydrorhamnose 3,5-epimerase [Fusobacterium necrophorum subsp. necrophorum]
MRGLHIQVGSSQGKLFEVLKGKIYDVVLRRGSSTYGKYYPVLLSAQKNILFWILEVFAHGFLSLKEETVIQYSYTNYYIPENKREIP